MHVVTAGHGRRGNPERPRVLVNTNLSHYIIGMDTLPILNPTTPFGLVVPGATRSRG
jgi:hypothetical protein